MRFHHHPPRSWGDFELLRCELEYCSKGGVVGHLQHLVGQLRVGGEGDLEGDLGSRHRYLSGNIPTFKSDDLGVATGDW